MTTLATIYETTNNSADFSACILDVFVEYIETKYIGRGKININACYLIENVVKDDNIDYSLTPIFNDIILNMYKNNVIDTDGLYNRLHLGPGITYLETYKFVKKFKIDNVLTEKQRSILNTIESWYKVPTIKQDDDDDWY